MTIMTRKILVSALAIGIAATATGVVAQNQREQDTRRWGNERSEATLYRDANYRGATIALRGEDPNIAIQWAPRSVRVSSGRWEFCEQAYFRGNCQVVDRDTPLLGGLRGMTVRSARPADNGGGSGNNPWNPGGPSGNGQSLRGNSAEFFTQPTERGRRIEACERGSATSNCVTRSADSFCRQQGWSRSVNATTDNVNRRQYLADVLCVRSAR